MDMSTIIALVSVIMTGLTSVFSLYLNYRTTTFTAAQSAEQRAWELHKPKVYESLRKFTEAYAIFCFDDSMNFDGGKPVSDQIPVFSSACLELAALIDDDEIRTLLLDISDLALSAHYLTTALEEKVKAVIPRISAYLAKY